MTKLEKKSRRQQIRPKPGGKARPTTKNLRRRRRYLGDEGETSKTRKSLPKDHPAAEEEGNVRHRVDRRGQERNPHLVRVRHSQKNLNKAEQGTKETIPESVEPHH